MAAWLVGFAQFFGWFGFVVIEGSLSSSELIRLHPRQRRRGLGAHLRGDAPRHDALRDAAQAKWRAASIAWIALAALLVGGVSLVARRVMPSVASGIAIDATLSTVSIACLTGGLGSLLFAFAVTNTLFNGIPMQHLRPHQQSAFQTPVQTLGAVGRGIGPYLATLAICTANSSARASAPSTCSSSRRPPSASASPPSRLAALFRPAAAGAHYVVTMWC